MDTEGFVKSFRMPKPMKYSALHIIRARAADLIQEATAVMEFRGSAEDIARMSHPHPTYSEAMKEAAQCRWPLHTHLNQCNIKWQQISWQD